MDKNTLIPVARDAAAGDPRALARLLDELEPLVVRTTRLIVGPGSVSAEDAAQEALIDMARGITRLRDPEAVISWPRELRRGARCAPLAGSGFAATVSRKSSPPRPWTRTMDAARL